MTPAPQSEAPILNSVNPTQDGNRVVVSGMSGLYPKSRYIRDLENILYNKINPISNDDLRWKFKHPEAAQYAGNVPDLDRFDAQFFKVHYRLGNCMDSMARKLLELAYEAIYDAGVSPADLSGKKVAVLIGSSLSESEKALFYSDNYRDGFGIAGCNKSMFANRISYWLNTKGPSLAIDDSCCSSTVAIEQAYLAIARGDCEAAIVGGASLCLHPQSGVHTARVTKTSKDGKIKSFDQNASGLLKTEAINILFLQKGQDARRIYATVNHVKNEFTMIPQGETGPKYGFYRDPEVTAGFLKRFYDSVGVSPNAVDYVEAFGSADLDVDKSELEAIDKIFCNGRDKQLMVGSVMSNIGYGEAASGISAITKVLLGFHRGELSGNLNYDTPRTDVDAIKQGRIQVLNNPQQFKGTYAAVNGRSVTGINAHVLLQRHDKPKELHRYKTNIPHLVTISGRQDSSVQRVFNELKSRPIDPEELALLNIIHETRISGHLGRGFAILDTDSNGKTISLAEHVNHFDVAQRPLWFVYSGMGSQWAGMGTQLMRMPIFAAAIERCDRVLRPKGLDIVQIITSSDKTTFNNILHSFVGIAAVQIGLTDILRELGLVPDKIIGHSVGELGCAYADGCLTAEEMILSAYSRGLVSLETPFIKGSMAAVGLGFEQISEMCPPEIEIACHNSAESCTISGPADAMKDFVAELVAKSIFAKEVPSSNIAYHSRYIANAGPGLLKYLKEVIKTPRLRTDRWVSTSVPQDKWNEAGNNYCSAEYHTNNLLSPVLFEETSKLIPNDAVLVEIAPHGLLQAILKRSLPESCVNIPLTRRGHPDGVMMVLEAVGKLFVEGYNPKVQAIYPKVEFPVSTGTPFLSHYVDWAHDEKWTVPLCATSQKHVTASCKFIISVHDDEYSYLRGHVIRQKTLLPYSFALVAAWDTLAMNLNVPKKQLSVRFRDVHFYAQPVLQNQKSLNLTVSLHKGNGHFEIMNEDFQVATGFLDSDIDEISKPKLNAKKDTSVDSVTFNCQDIYRLLYERGYAYSEDFRSIHSANDKLTEANVLWNDNWVTFIDGLFQLNALKHPHHDVSEPSRISSLTINVTEHAKYTEIKNTLVPVIKASSCDYNKFTRCGGVLIEHASFYDFPSLKNDDVQINGLQFVPCLGSNINALTSLQIFIQIVAENINKDSIKIVGLANQLEDKGIFKAISAISWESVCDVKVEYKKLIKDSITESSEKLIKEADIVIVQNLSKYNKISDIFESTDRNNMYIINEDLSQNLDIMQSAAYKVLYVLSNKDKDPKLQLIIYKPTLRATSTRFTFVRTETDIPSLTATRNSLTPNSALRILAPYPAFSGLKSLIKKWRKDASRNNINLTLVKDIEHVDNLEKLPSDLAYNIFENGICGGEYYLPISSKYFIDDESQVTSQTVLTGNIDTLQWVQTPSLNETGVTVKVHYAGIHLNDIRKATGVTLLKDEDTTKDYGMEFSGLTESGERVMGLLPKGAARSQVVAKPEFIWPVPSHWTLEEAATVPLAYMKAYCCIDIKYAGTCSSKIHSVLVHGGAGALGQAVISVSLAKGYRVFATVRDMKKKKFLLKMFPELREDDIGNSRDISFSDMVRGATGGRGCDLVICNVKRELKNDSLNCIAFNGLLVDTNQVHSQENFSLGMNIFNDGNTYKTLDISSIFDDPKSAGEAQRLHELVSEGIALGHVRPLSRVVYVPEEVTRAFRLVAGSQHRGRVLLQLHGQRLPTRSRLICSGVGCHMIFCDTQPLGIQLAEMLIGSGAKKLHLHVPQPSSYLRYKQMLWNKRGVEVTISSEDINKVGLSSILSSAASSVPVVGVYAAAADVLNPTLLTSLDLATRTLCPSLKYFLLFSNGDDTSQYISINRAKDSLPATMINLSKLKQVEYEGLTWYQGIKAASERAILSSHPVVLAHSKHQPKTSLVQKIAALTDTIIHEEENDAKTIQDLGVEQEKSRAISFFLKDTHSVSIDESNIPTLTIKRIKQIEDSLTDSEFEDLKGLNAYFSYVDADELMATTEIISMSTRTTTSLTRDDEFDVNERYMCILPGLEGHYQRFRSLCKRLKLPAFVLQPGFDYVDEPLKNLALRYAKTVLKRSGVKKHFYLLGFETGVLAALELASILEQNGHTGTVFCIGDGPEETKALLQHQLRDCKSEEDLQTKLIQHMSILMAGESARAIENQIDSSLPWHERVELCVRNLLGHVSHSAQYARGVISSAYSRIASVINYIPDIRPLQSQIILLRPRNSVLTATEPSSLQRFSKQPLVVHNLITPMEHSVKDMQCAALINKYLAEDILEAFEKKNLCSVQNFNADIFISYS